MNLHQEMLQIAAHARQASQQLAILTTQQKNTMLKDMAAALDAEHAAIKAANAKDLENARQKNLSAARLDRLLMVVLMLWLKVCYISVVLRIQSG